MQAHESSLSTDVKVFGASEEMIVNDSFNALNSVTLISRMTHKSRKAQVKVSEHTLEIVQIVLESWCSI